MSHPKNKPKNPPREDQNGDNWKVAGPPAKERDQDKGRPGRQRVSKED